ncbi:MAG TPA: serine/threonine-protein kinase [Kofleriaceae bacterium]|nr:serine/threonine-protein kinase [Kofleriaceae bacterium]
MATDSDAPGRGHAAALRDLAAHAEAIAAAERSGPEAGPLGSMTRGRDLASDRRSAAGSLIGRTVGDFAIDAVIGGGSFGTVYRGRQLGLERPVAIKVPSHEIAADPVQARRFAREARAAARIVHPGVVAIYAVGELDDGRPYLAMQLIEGEPLDRVLRDGPVPLVRALGIARDIASALSETHAADVVHRDLKPTNIMWRRDRNGDDRITLVDFGIAVCRPGNADATRLTTGGLIGTPHYMSPEQAQGEQVDPRADLYALGCLLFELVTGAPPFDGSGFEVLLAHLGRPAPRASDRNPAVPESVDRLIAHLMAKRPDDRPASADAVVALLDDAIASLSRSWPLPGAQPRTRAPTGMTELDLPAGTTGSPRLRFAALIALGALALSGVGFAALRLRGGAAEADEPEPTEAVPGRPVSGSGEALRLIARDDGELIVRTLVPEVIHAGIAIHGHLEITTKLGARFSAKQVVITVEDPHHRATAQTAAMHGDGSGHYAFRHTFAEPGTYVLRIFPSEAQTVSTVELDVVP